MNDPEYWWDRSGAADREIRRLEKLLSPFRHRPARQRLYVGYTQAGLALAAVIVLFWLSGPGVDRRATAWSVHVLTGAPTIASLPVSDSGKITVGQWLLTDDSSAADITLADVGRVRVEPRSRLRLIGSDSLGYRLRLEEGMIHAALWAPPRLVMVETPAALVVDLGCEYTLAVDELGHGRLCVETGWVSLERGERMALVPSGAQCEMRPGTGPGTPYLAGASPDYLEMLRAFDFEPGAPDRAQELIDRASSCDAFSLVYLVDRVAPHQRGQIFDRVSALYPPWVGITRAGIVNLESSMVATWQDQFECFESEQCRASCLPEVL